MIIAYHFIFSACGFWLPNDPRGSWSDTIRQYELLKFGPATKVTTHRNLAHDSHDRELRKRAKEALMYKPVRFTGVQARALYRGFVVAISERGYMIRALAILPDHVHAVVMRHARRVDQIAAHLKAKATAQLNIEEIHPLAAHPRADGTIPSPWSRNYWSPFIEEQAHLAAVINYVNRNPSKSGLPDQYWRLEPA